MRNADDPVEATDADLMRRTAAGDRDAFAALYRRHSAMVFRFARLMIGCNAAAEDIVQEAFLALMRDATRYDPDRSALSTYLYGVARRQTRRRLLRDRRFVALESSRYENDEPAADDDAAGDLLRRSDIARLRQAILSLPSRYREIVVLCDLQDLSYADAATTLECPVGTIRSRLHRARQLLAEKLLRSGAREEVLARRTMRCAV